MGPAAPRGRPLSLLRCPEGITAQCFFQKHAWAGLGDAVRRVSVPNDEQSMLVIDDLPACSSWCRPASWRFIPGVRPPTGRSYLTA